MLPEYVSDFLMRCMHGVFIRGAAVVHCSAHSFSRFTVHYPETFVAQHEHLKARDEEFPLSIRDLCKDCYLLGSEAFLRESERSDELNELILFHEMI